MISTRPHSVSPGAYSARLMGEWVSRYWWVIAVPVVPCLLVGYFDLRFFIVAAAWLLIVMPGILALVYFRYALSPEAARMTLPHTVSFSEREIIISWHETEYHDELMPYADVKKVEDTGSMLVITPSNAFRPIMIPLKDFEGQKQVGEVIDLLTKAL